MTQQADRFQISRTFPAKRSRVWAAWTQPGQLAQWFGPPGSEASVLEYDLRPGGAWRGKMEVEGAPTMYSKFVFRDVEPEYTLSWVHGFADAEGNRIRAPFPGPPWPLEMLTVVTFEDDSEGTRVTLTFTPMNSSDEERATFSSNLDSMNGGWSWTFDALEEFLR